MEINYKQKGGYNCYDNVKSINFNTPPITINCLANKKHHQTLTAYLKKFDDIENQYAHVRITPNSFDVSTAQHFFKNNFKDYHSHVLEVDTDIGDLQEQLLDKTMKEFEYIIETPKLYQKVMEFRKRRTPKIPFIDNMIIRARTFINVSRDYGLDGRDVISSLLDEYLQNDRKELESLLTERKDNEINANIIGYENGKITNKTKSQVLISVINDRYSIVAVPNFQKMGCRHMNIPVSRNMNDEIIFQNNIDEILGTSDSIHRYSISMKNIDGMKDTKDKILHRKNFFDRYLQKIQNTNISIRYICFLMSNSKDDTIINSIRDLTDKYTNILIKIQNRLREFINKEYGIPKEHVIIYCKYPQEFVHHFTLHIENVIPYNDVHIYQHVSKKIYNLPNIIYDLQLIPNYYRQISIDYHVEKRIFYSVYLDILKEIIDEQMRIYLEKHLKPALINANISYPNLNEIPKPEEDIYQVMFHVRNLENLITNTNLQLDIGLEYHYFKYYKSIYYNYLAIDRGYKKQISDAICNPLTTQKMVKNVKNKTIQVYKRNYYRRREEVDDSQKIWDLIDYLKDENIIPDELVRSYKRGRSKIFNAQELILNILQMITETLREVNLNPIIIYHIKEVIESLNDPQPYLQALNKLRVLDKLNEKIKKLFNNIFFSSSEEITSQVLPLYHKFNLNRLSYEEKYGLYKLLKNKSYGDIPTFLASFDTPDVEEALKNKVQLKEAILFMLSEYLQWNDNKINKFIGKLDDMNLLYLYVLLEIRSQRDNKFIRDKISNFVKLYSLENFVVSRINRTNLNTHYILGYYENDPSNIISFELRPKRVIYDLDYVLANMKCKHVLTSYQNRFYIADLNLFEYHQSFELVNWYESINNQKEIKKIIKQNFNQNRIMIALNSTREMFENEVKVTMDLGPIKKKLDQQIMFNNWNYVRNKIEIINFIKEEATVIQQFPRYIVEKLMGISQLISTIYEYGLERDFIYITSNKEHIITPDPKWINYDTFFEKYVDNPYSNDIKNLLDNFHFTSWWIHPMYRDFFVEDYNGKIVHILWKKRLYDKNKKLYYINPEQEEYVKNMMNDKFVGEDIIYNVFDYYFENKTRRRKNLTREEITAPTGILKPEGYLHGSRFLNLEHLPGLKKLFMETHDFLEGNSTFNITRNDIETYVHYNPYGNFSTLHVHFVHISHKYAAASDTEHLIRIERTLDLFDIIQNMERREDYYQKMNLEFIVTLYGRYPLFIDLKNMTLSHSDYRPYADFQELGSVIEETTSTPEDMPPLIEPPVEPKLTKRQRKRRREKARRKRRR